MYQTSSVVREVKIYILWHLFKSRRRFGLGRWRSAKRGKFARHWPTYLFTAAAPLGCTLQPAHRARARAGSRRRGKWSLAARSAVM